MQNKILGFIGGGAMGEAIIAGILKAGIITASQIIVNDISKTRLQYLKEKYMLKTYLEIQTMIKEVDILIIAVKPQVVHNVYKEIKGLKNDILIVSIVAGLNLESIEKHIPESPVIRVVTNIPVAVCGGMSTITIGRWVKNKHIKEIKNLFESIGKIIIVNETQLDAVTSISGCGPGYVFMLIDALTDAGVLVGLSRSMATILCAQTLLGSAKMILETEEHPAKLRDITTSSGGITIQGIQILEQRAIRAALIDAVARTTELSREIRNKFISS